MKLTKRTLNQLIKEEINQLFQIHEASFRANRGEIMADLDKAVAAFNKYSRAMKEDPKDMGNLHKFRSARKSLAHFRLELKTFDEDMRTKKSKLSPLGKKAQKWYGKMGGTIETDPEKPLGYYKGKKKKKKRRRGRGGCRKISGTGWCRQYPRGKMPAGVGFKSHAEFYAAADRAGLKLKKDKVWGRGHWKVWNKLKAGKKIVDPKSGAARGVAVSPETADLVRGKGEKGDALMAKWISQHRQAKTRLKKHEEMAAAGGPKAPRWAKQVERSKALIAKLEKAMAAKERG